MVRLTSIEAYHWLKDYGHIGEKQQIVYECIMKNPDLNDREISEKLSMKINCVNGRRNELLNIGVIKCSGKKVDSVTKRLTMSWSTVRIWDSNKSPKKKRSPIDRSKILKLITKYLRHSQNDCCKGILNMFKEEILK